jgi:hypothetical protein
VLDMAGRVTGVTCETEISAFYECSSKSRVSPRSSLSSR